MSRYCFRALLFGVAALAIAAAAVTAWSDPVPQFVLRWGSYGDGPGQFGAAADVAVAPDGNVYVVDGANARFEVFTADGSFLYLWSAANFSPNHLAIDHAGNVFGLSGEIAKFTATGQEILRWGGGGPGPGHFGFANSIAILPNDHVLVGDNDRPSLQEFTNSGEFVRDWAVPGTGLGQIDRGVLAMTAAPTGDVFVYDGGHRVQRFTSAGVYVSTWSFPVYYFASDAGFVFATDNTSVPVHVFTYDGQPLFTFGQSELSGISAIASAGDAIYVADGASSSIVKFTTSPVGVTPTTWSAVKLKYSGLHP